MAPTVLNHCLGNNNTNYITNSFRLVARRIRRKGCKIAVYGRGRWIFTFVVVAKWGVFLVVHACGWTIECNTKYAEVSLVVW